MLLTALVSGSTAAEAAAVAGVGERTVRRRIADPTFAERVDAARAEMVEAALARLSSGAITAVDTLRSLMSPEGPPSVRLGAAKAFLEYGIRLRAEQELCERLKAVEVHLGLDEEDGP